MGIIFNALLFFGHLFARHTLYFIWLYSYHLFYGHFAFLTFFFYQLFYFLFFFFTPNRLILRIYHFWASNFEFIYSFLTFFIYPILFTHKFDEIQCKRIQCSGSRGIIIRFFFCHCISYSINLLVGSKKGAKLCI